MLSRATASLTGTAAKLGRIVSLAIPAVASTCAEAVVAAPARQYTRGKWAGDQMRTKQIALAASKKNRAKQLQENDVKKAEEKKAAVASATLAPAKDAVPVGTAHATDLAMLETLPRNSPRSNVIFASLKERSAIVPFTSREITSVIQQVARFPKNARYAFELFQSALDNKEMFIESRMFTAMKDVCEASKHWHAWSQLHIAHMRLFPTSTVNWLGEEVVNEVKGTFTLAPMQALFSHKSSHQDLVDMVAAKRTTHLELMPKTRVHLAMAHFHLNQTDKALEELWAFWKLSGFTDGTVPAPFAPVRGVFNLQWQFIRADLPAPVDMLLALSSALEHAGQYSAALTNLAFMRAYTIKYDYAPLRETTALGVTRDFLDLSHVTGPYIATALRINLTEMRIRRSMTAAIEALPADKRPTTFVPPAGCNPEAPLLTDSVEDLVVLTDRSMRLARAPEEGLAAVRDLMKRGGGLKGVKEIRMHARTFSKWSSNPSAEIAEKAAAEHEAVMNAKHPKGCLPERTVIITKDELIRVLDNSAKAVKAKLPLG